MNKHFYLKLAAGNLKKNSRTYLPYILACTFSIAMFYIISMLSGTEFFEHDTLKQMLFLGTIIIGIFSAVFLFYTNSFLIKRRKMEFGLYNVLGMNKRHIAKVIAIETVYTALISMILGIGFGILLSKLVYLILENIITFKLKDQIMVSPTAIGITLLFFAVIFFLTLLNSLRMIHLSKPIELLRGGQSGEKEPKTRWMLTITGIFTLGAGYYMAITIQDPLEALLFFFVAVILVIFGTYCLFTAISIFVLKMLRKNKRFYYKTSNFISVSGMMYRMKQNAVGLANICILSTIVLVTISTTVSLYTGVEDILDHRYPKDMIVETEYNEKTIAEIDEKINEILNEGGYEALNKSELRLFTTVVAKQNDKFNYEGYFNNQAEGVQCSLGVFPLDDYNKATGNDAELEEGEVLVYTNKKDYDGKYITIGDMKFTVKAAGGIKDGSEDAEKLDTYIGMSSLDSYCLVVDSMDTVLAIKTDAQKELKKVLPADEAAILTVANRVVSFDVDTSPKKEIALKHDLDEGLSELLLEEGEFTTYADSRAANELDFYNTFGGLLFLGLYLAVLFLMATVLIIYYKQLSEGYEDKERFRIMQNVGLTKKEVRKAIRSQVLTMFFLPLIVACMHISFAFPMISKLLLLFNLDDTGLFMICTLICAGVFAVFYIIVYAMTSRMYYKIVEEV